MDRRFAPLFIIVVIDLIGFGIVIPVLPLYAEDHFGAGDVQITLLIAAFSAAQFLASPLLGRLSDALGRRPVLIASQLGTMLGFLVLGFANSLFLLYLGRIIDGLSGGNITTVRAYITDITSEKNRAQGFGLISAAFGTGFVLGPVLGGLTVKGAQLVPFLAPYSQNVPFFVAALFSLGSVMATYTLLEESLSPEERKQASQDKQEADISLGQVLRVNGVRLIIVFSGITFLAFAIFQSSFPLTASRNAFSRIDTEDAQFNIALLLTWMGFLIVVVQARLVGPAVRRFGERRLVVFGALIRIPAFLGIAIAHSPWVIALSFIPLALGNGVSQPSLQSLISRYAPPSMRGEVLGVFQSTRSLTLIFGPLMAGPLLQRSPSAPQFVAAGLIAAASLLSFQVLKLTLPSQEGSPAQVEMAPAG